MNTLTILTPNRKKALFLAKKQLPELVCDAVNLEGIHYTLPEVQTLLDGVTVGGHRQIDETITMNQSAAWQSLFASIDADDFNLSAEFVCQLHNIIAKDEALTWGKFRDGGVTIAGTDYIPPKAKELPFLWQQLAEKYDPVLHQSQINTEHTYTHAVSLFLQMARIQFFHDVNKRLGRLMMNGILLSNGLPAINLPAKKQLTFNQLMLDFYPSGNEQPMQTFMLGCLEQKILRIMAENANI